MTATNTFLEEYTRWFNSPSIALTVKSITAGAQSGKEALYSRLLDHLVPAVGQMRFFEGQDNELRTASLLDNGILASPAGVLNARQFEMVHDLAEGAADRALTVREIDVLPAPSTDGYALRAGFSKLLKEARALSGLEDARIEHGGLRLPAADLPLKDVFTKPLDEVEAFFQWHFGSDEALGILEDPDTGNTILPGGEEFGRCTNSANWMSSMVHGETMGFLVEDNPTATDRSIDQAGGHDFTVVDRRFVIDLWNAVFVGNGPEAGQRDPIVFDLECSVQAQRVEELYGSKENWRALGDAPFLETAPMSPA